jgi:hypothetical protein
MEVDWKLATQAFAIGGAFDTETGIASSHRTAGPELRRLQSCFYEALNIDSD